MIFFVAFLLKIGRKFSVGIRTPDSRTEQTGGGVPLVKVEKMLQIKSNRQGHDIWILDSDFDCILHTYGR